MDPVGVYDVRVWMGLGARRELVEESEAAGMGMWIERRITPQGFRCERGDQFPLKPQRTSAGELCEVVRAEVVWQEGKEPMRITARFHSPDQRYVVLWGVTEMRVSEEVADTLATITELGFVAIGNGGILFCIPPVACIWRPVRWEPTMNYLAGYASLHPLTWAGEFFVSAYDGFREASRFVPHGCRRYVPWTLELNPFFSETYEGATRFMHRHPDPALYPVLCRPVLAYSRHRDDPATLLIPDPEFLATGFLTFLKDAAISDITWERKRTDVVMWRGRRHVVHFPGSEPHVRDEAVALSGGQLKGVLDASFDTTSVEEQLKSAYLLDLDGSTHAWSGGYWKLASGSVVFRLESSPWEFWYSRQLRPFEHYVPLQTLGEVPRMLEWCRSHDDECRLIAKRATKLTNKLTLRYALRGYVIR